MQVFKIRNKDTRLYSTGGSSPSWSKKGKTWSSIGYVKSHLNLVHNCHYYDNAEIVEIEVNENDLLTYPVKELINEIESNKLEKQKRFEEYRQKQIEEREKKLLQELKDKYEGDK